MKAHEKAIRILEGNYKGFVLHHNGELLTVNELIALLKAQEPRVMTLEEQPTVDGWVSVKDRLPSADGHYLTYCISYCDVVSFSTCLEDVDDYDFDGKKRPGWFSYDDEYGYYENTGVTHWMPLPEPPKEEDDEH